MAFPLVQKSQRGTRDKQHHTPRRAAHGSPRGLIGGSSSRSPKYEGVRVCTGRLQTPLASIMVLLVMCLLAQNSGQEGGYGKLTPYLPLVTRSF